MNVILFGENKCTEYFVKILKDEGHEITLVNSNYDLCRKIADKYEIPAICESDINEFVFKNANAHKADLVISLYENDADNLVVCEISKKTFHVKSTYAVVNNPDNIDVFYSLGIDKCISTPTILKQMINQDSIAYGIDKYFNAKSKNYFVREFQVTNKSECKNKKLWELNLPECCNVVSVFRNNEIIIPQGSTQFILGDKVLVTVSAQVINQVQKMFTDKDMQAIIV
ncbi:trk system potassium uptake protein TrkA [Hydrogenoanaerobacterium saccharovorans]|uniref:Trk system potassium uptake protein TrkA n=1 Tax=Hydrogenoanaerobacterium saccharovorans TaxID=474960 RepID=A0A1H8BL25_9FIRM|nr:TrkA family potassium uptake protein [Hydrogenoanaerobacterium saccharovorans]RPF47349.1 trk system potassium uptake protein TrkA [Hydrogenoanaerobacterium saccharovorans]SEM83591.1 trk system potassium uptake protein TrkA [Hydrogenoanaerobacterium saccharovorans]